jgi:DNA-binding NtrC family response regulator
VSFPEPAALLVEHPAVPVPGIVGETLVPVANGDRVEATSLSKTEKSSVALQLTAAASLLAEFDLWAGRSAIRDARFVRTEFGVRTTLARFPVPMSRVFALLGGGEPAAATTRSAVLEGISEAVGLSLKTIDHAKGEPGFFLERAIARQVEALKQPLDLCTARALWAFRWDALPLPEDGATDFWEVPSVDLAQRLGAALWAALRRRRKNTWLWATHEDHFEITQTSMIGSAGTLVVVGTINPQDLAAVSRWVEGEGRRAAVIGRFPSGWHPPKPPVFDAGNLYRHLAVTGMSLGDARRVVEQRQSRIDPFERTDRRALTEAGQRVFSPVAIPRRATRASDVSKRLWRTLALSPDGLPVDFVMRHSGHSRRTIQEQSNRLSIVESDDRMRLAEPVPLEPDPLHLAVADLHDEDDPRRYLHRALGNGDVSDLAGWARDRLDDLDGYSVRDLLSPVSAGALGHEVGLLQAEACLSIYDVSGARRALDSIPPQLGEALATWMEGLDDRPGTLYQLPEEAQLAVSPRAVAEAGLLVLNHDRRRGTSSSGDARDLVLRARELVAPPVRRHLDIDLAWVADGGEFDDPAWRRKTLGRHPVLRAHYAHRRALQLMDRQQPRAVRRFLELLNDDRLGPGFLGLVEQDLGATALDEGRSLEADRHQLRAYRLLEAAGFQQVTHRALFNLAVGDLDQLEIDRAKARFAALAEKDPGGPYVIGERARLALAEGDLASFRSRLSALEESVNEENPRFSEGLCFLRGVAALFERDIGRARRLLQQAGQEGVAWTDLADTLTGSEAGSWQPDGWGVSLAAEVLRDARGGGDQVTSLLSHGSMTKSVAFAMALAEHFGRDRLPISEQMRIHAVRVLRDGSMDGWADVLIGGSVEESGVVKALAQIVERGGPEKLPPDLAANLMLALGISGLEVRDAADGQLVWRLGAGEAGAEIRQGRIVVVPLGGEAHHGPTWLLLSRIIELYTPMPTNTSDPEAEKTGFFGVSAAARRLRTELRELGPSHLPILLQGETGVGKEVAARALHRLSNRRGAFVPVNMAAIPSNLLEAELFGSVKGAYTGADRSRQGLVMTANGGTLFLDEVGDLDPPLQVKLLRFLDSQEVRAVGSTTPKPVDVRILSATHRDLERRVREGGFRQDLYYRIAAPALTIPPLRQRREDIGLLRDLFARRAEARHGIAPCTWSGEAETLMRRYHWPGNVRELRQAVEVALVRASGGLVRREHLPIAVDEFRPSGTWEEAQREFRRRYLRAALERNNWNRSATARELDISRQALLYHLRNLGITGSSER